jgi:hypothetical protein
MSSKSDNDNHSNQLNPNNDEYWNSRGESNDKGDEDDDYSPSPRKNWGQYNTVADAAAIRAYYFAAVAFDGNAVHARFQTKINKPFGIETSESSNIAKSMRDALLAKTEKKFPLGVAYWRLATDTSRGNFYWYNPPLQEKDLVRLKKNYSEIEINQMQAWYSNARELANHFEGLFDWGTHGGAHDFGLLTQEVEIPY